MGVISEEFEVHIIKLNTGLFWILGVHAVIGMGAFCM